jgi:F0F1-type ATP synthase assembly protein I
MAQSNQDRRGMINTILIVLVGQVGCLTLVVILLSVFGGLWLDDLFNTKPFFTLILLLAGIPLSVILMLVAARRTLARLKTRSGMNDPDPLD